MSRLTTLHIPPTPTGAPPTPQQKRFNTLIRQIEQARDTLSAWNENVALYRQAHAQVLLPLQEDVRASLRQWLAGLDALSQQKGWTKAERGTLSALIRESAAALLAGAGDDAELKALFDRHSDVDFDTGQRERALAMKALAEEMTGLDLGGEEDIADHAALFERMREGLAQQAANEQARREQRAAGRRKTAAQQRREAEAQQATQSVREIYRKLASALHPDRETDAGERAAKTELMQRVNQAYAAGNLLALLELQLRIEQIDASHVASASDARLKHYNKVLAQQLAELRQEIEDAERAWKIEFDVSPLTPADPRRLGDVLERSRRAWRGELATLQSEIRMFAQAAATKQWLQRQRERLRSEAFDLPF